jgi:hypothetical protein
MSFFDQPTRNIPAEIHSLITWGIRSIHIPLTDEEAVAAIASVETFQAYVEATYNRWFANEKPCTDAMIGNHIFKMRWQNERERIQYELAGLLQSTERTLKAFKQLIYPANKDPKRLDIASNVLSLLSSYGMDAIGILQRGDAEIDKNIVPYGFFQSNAVTSPNTFRASRMMLAEMVYGKIEAHASSVFLLRQAIELRIKRALGIEAIYDSSNHAPIIVSLSKLIDFVKHHPNEISFAVDWKQIEIINKWSNYTVHGGWVPPVWQIEFAQHLISSVFQWGHNNAFGAVKATESFSAGLETALQDYLRLTDKKIKPKADGTYDLPDKYSNLTIERTGRLEAVEVDTL